MHQVGHQLELRRDAARSTKHKSHNHFVPFRFLSITDPSLHHLTLLRVRYVLKQSIGTIRYAGKLICIELNDGVKLPLKVESLELFCRKEIFTPTPLVRLHVLVTSGH